ncbi:hypothetical protein AALO_G00098200 [Alosa alosa]|uniref:Uncharacterized protein n=1 Tax=Alosa alosa TaxID=278164 RepID=A0AAV6GU86_9TELE|nr:hypothetical protein AALO_G00098200 [Alosa alosa]
MYIKTSCCTQSPTMMSSPSTPAKESTGRSATSPMTDWMTVLKCEYMERCCGVRQAVALVGLEQLRDRSTFEGGCKFPTRKGCFLLTAPGPTGMEV